VRDFLAKFPAVLDEIEKMLNKNKIFKDRTINVGNLTKEQAISYGLTGPLLRACGVPYDIRKTRPYLCYDQLNFDVPTRSEGDVFARIRSAWARCAKPSRSSSSARQTARGPGQLSEPQGYAAVKEMVTRTWRA
jgi:NADH-quinone oxidoreductase subunit D